MEKVFADWYAENLDADYDDICNKVGELLSKQADESYGAGYIEGKHNGFEEGLNYD